MWIGNTNELKLVFVFLAVGYLGYFVLFLEKKCQEKNCEGGGESSDHQDTIEGARAVGLVTKRLRGDGELIPNV